MFVTTCTEKWVVADRIGMEIGNLRPKPPALRVFDGGVGDGTILARVMRDLHRSFPTVRSSSSPRRSAGGRAPFAGEGAGPVRRASRDGDGLHQPALCRRASLTPSRPAAAEALNWHEIPLSGSSAADFRRADQEPGRADRRRLAGHRQPDHRQPALCETDRAGVVSRGPPFLLDDVIPQSGGERPGYDLVIASQPFRARAPTEKKAKTVLAPLARSLVPGGRMLTTYSIGDDPGLEIVRAVCRTRRRSPPTAALLIKALKAELAASEPDLVFDALTDDRSLFKFRMHSLPNCQGASIGTRR